MNILYEITIEKPKAKITSTANSLISNFNKNLWLTFYPKHETHNIVFYFLDNPIIFLSKLMYLSIHDNIFLHWEERKKYMRKIIVSMI